MTCFNVNDYGACPDGKTLNTKAFQAAIDACHEAGGGVVVCESGEYLSGSIELKSNVELHLAPGCRIVGSTDVDDYVNLISDGFYHERAPEGTATYLIGARHAANIAITGSGEINASGLAFYDQDALTPKGKFAKKPEKRPRLLMFHKCVDVRIEDASFIDSPCWTFWLMMCERVRIRGIKIIGDQRMINNDGIDIDSCKNVRISDCFIKTDDDCIVVRAIQSKYDSPAICENIAVSNCNLESTCQCVRISCPSDNITRNCVFTNLTMKSERNGINFDFPNRYLSKGSSGSADVTNISFSNIVMDCLRHPIRIEVQEGIKLTQVAGITFSDMRLKGGYPCIVKGNEHTIIEDVVFNNIRLDCSGDQAVVCSKCRGVKMNNVELNNCD